VLVKVPYFPNWHASGALGPYEVSPNLMAVVPTAHHVTLAYGTTGADQIGKLASLGGAVGLGMLMTLRPPAMGRPARAPVPSPEPVPGEKSEATLPARSQEEETEPADDSPTPEPYGPAPPPPDLTELEDEPDWSPDPRSLPPGE
jgi:hypothetical protein